MKKLIVMAAMALSSIGAFAQYQGGEFTLQPKIGANVAMLTNMGEVNGIDMDGGSRATTVIGVEAEYHANKTLGISAGVIYSQQGSEVTVSRTGYYTNEKYKKTIKLDYINVPILANIYVAKGLALKAGIQPGFNIKSKNAKDIIETNTGQENTEEEIDIEKFDFSIPMGVSYEFGGGFCFDARYNLGVTKVFKNTEKDIKNSVFQFTFGYKFKL